MADKSIINNSTLTDIADAIRLKRDLVRGIDPADMALQIQLIESGGIEIQSGTITMASHNYSIYLPKDQLPKIYIKNSLFHIFRNNLIAPAISDRYVVSASMLLSDSTRILKQIAGTWISMPGGKGTTSSGNEYSCSAVTAGTNYICMNGKTGEFRSYSTLRFEQQSNGTWFISTSSTADLFCEGEYQWQWIYFGNDPDNDIVYL